MNNARSSLEKKIKNLSIDVTELMKPLQEFLDSVMQNTRKTVQENDVKLKYNISQYIKKNKNVFDIMQSNEWFYDKGFLFDNGVDLDAQIIKIGKTKTSKAKIDNLMIKSYNEEILEKTKKDIFLYLSDNDVKNCIEQCFKSYNDKNYYLTYCGAIPIIDYILRLKDKSFKHEGKKARKAGRQILTDYGDKQPLEIYGSRLGNLFCNTYYTKQDCLIYKGDIVNRNNIHGYYFNRYTQKSALNNLILIHLLSYYLN